MSHLGLTPPPSNLWDIFKFQTFLINVDPPPSDQIGIFLNFGQYSKLHYQIIEIGTFLKNRDPPLFSKFPNWNWDIFVFYPYWDFVPNFLDFLFWCLPKDRSISLGQCIEQSSIDHCVGTYDLFITIKYFCGKDYFCKHHPDTDYAMNLAITNIDKFYLVVGVLEQFKKTLSVLEYLLPKYFSGAVAVYEEQKRKGKNVHEKCLAGLEPVKDKEEPAYQQLKEYLYREYKVYNHVIHQIGKAVQKYLGHCQFQQL